MTIEEVSILFDTGRKGNAQAAALALADNSKTRGLGIEDDDVDVQNKTNATSHVEVVGNKSERSGGR